MICEDEAGDIESELAVGVEVGAGWECSAERMELEVDGCGEDIGIEGTVDSSPEVVHGVRSNSSGYVTLQPFLVAACPQKDERFR